MVVHQHEDKQSSTHMRLLESPKSEGSEPQVLDHIHALICSEIQQALGATSHHSPGADATSQYGESSSNQVPTVTSGSNPVPPNTVPIVSSSADSVSSQLECHVCVHVCVCVCGSRGTEASIQTSYGLPAGSGAIYMCMYRGEFTSSQGRVKHKQHVRN